MPQRDPTPPSTPSPIIALDLGALIEQFREAAHQAAYEGTRQALAESAAQAGADCWLSSAQVAKLLGYPSQAAFKQARNRNPVLAALGIKHGKLWRYRRSDLEAYMSAHPRKRKGAEK
jgi:hypothetical protein